ncbi:3'-5' exoribonuclease YhaM family protein [Mesoplasma photuris]|uniref:3'-5' exoribonuclease YhaM family protein n=1 Tax=Mesoplasma photuris TaxID=217731 RepID=UPI0004E27E80|nr:HD domain-containing protein [Mesoplasma photuris]
MIKIKDITNELNTIELVARVEKVIVSTGSNGNNYMIVHLSDKTGRVEARKWTVSDIDREVIKPNCFIHFNDIVVTEYRGVIQLKVNNYNIIEENQLDKFNLSKEDFFVTAPVNIEKEYTKLMEILNNIQNETYKTLTIGLIKKYETEFLTYPAAMSIHHNVAGGLFWHSYTLVRNCLAIKPSYGYADIDWELLICGAILHDIGKVIEIDDQTGVDYSLEGKLIGHISIGNTELNKIADELNLAKLPDGTINPSLTLLQHMIIASHGKKEYGSPIEPSIIEAIILSTFDDLDARIFKINDQTNKVDLNTWSARIPSEEGKMFLNHFKK